MYCPVENPTSAKRFLEQRFVRAIIALAEFRTVPKFPYCYHPGAALPALPPSSSSGGPPYQRDAQGLKLRMSSCGTGYASALRFRRVRAARPSGSVPTPNLSSSSAPEAACHPDFEKNSTGIASATPELHGCATSKRASERFFEGRIVASRHCYHLLALHVGTGRWYCVLVLGVVHTGLAESVSRAARAQRRLLSDAIQILARADKQLFSVDGRRGAEVFGGIGDSVDSELLEGLARLQNIDVAVA